MPRRTFHVAEVLVNDEAPQGVVHGGFLIWSDDGSTNTNAPVHWRVHLHTTKPNSWTVKEPHRLAVDVQEGHRFVGTAELYESDGKGHLFTGSGLPDEFDENLLRS